LRQACVDGADVAIGSRYLTGVNVVNWPMGRVLMSYYASVYVRIVTGMPVHDSTAGFVCYRSRVLRALPLDKIRFQGSINIEPVGPAHALINVNWMRMNLPAEDTYYLAEIKDGRIVATHEGVTYVDSSEPLSEIKEKLSQLDSPIPVGFDEFNNTIFFKGTEYSEFE